MNELEFDETIVNEISSNEINEISENLDEAKSIGDDNLLRKIRRINPFNKIEYVGNVTKNKYGVSYRKKRQKKNKLQKKSRNNNR